MIERDHPALSVGVQCRLLSISRSSFYHEPTGETEMNLGLMQLIDRQFLDTPFYGVRQMTWHLQNEGLGDRLAGQGCNRSLDHLLQPPAVPCRPWWTAARRGLLQPDRNRPAGEGSSLDGPEICPTIRQ
ncbi:hypothetical protein [Paracoccus aminovorans]|nr:hypothetical protein [Paracoccus aminovorans]